MTINRNIPGPASHSGVYTLVYGIRVINECIIREDSIATWSNKKINRITFLSRGDTGLPKGTQVGDGGARRGRECR